METDGAIDIAVLSLAPRFRIYSLNLLQFTCIKLLCIYCGSPSHSFVHSAVGKNDSIDRWRGN